MEGGPHYKRPFKIERYLRKGDPRELTEQGLHAAVPNWVPPTPEELDLWPDAQTTVLNKRNRREFKITTEAVRTVGPNQTLKITILHIDYRGFIYSAAARTTEELEKNFWPTVNKLIAYFISPKILHIQSPQF